MECLVSREVTYPKDQLASNCVEENGKTAE